MNDGACDPQGRFWAGTMAYDEAPGAGSLYRLELDGRCTQVLTGLTISNGIGWSPDGTTMYLADSGTGDIDAFDFDPVTGRHRPSANDRAHQHAECGTGWADRRRQRRHLGRAVERRRSRAVPPRRVTADYHPTASRPANFLRVRRYRRGNAIRHHRPRRTGRSCARRPAGRRAPATARLSRRHRAALPALPRAGWRVNSRQSG